MCADNQATVFVIDDDPAVRRSLLRLIESVPRPVRTYANAEEFLDDYEPGMTGCLVTDVRMPGLDGVELHRTLVARGFSIPVIIISGHAEVHMAVDSMRLGAVDFIEKPFRPRVLLDRIAVAIELDSSRRRQREQRDSARNQLARLTPREREILALVVQGKPGKQIANELGVTEKTIENHRANIRAKTQARSLPALVRLAALADSPDNCAASGSLGVFALPT
ncbi:MAG: response regulator transcription factor [Planctomycetes bacterium]|nr:response regulator transcription factor [Planctomycetota bacterium]